MREEEREKEIMAIDGDTKIIRKFYDKVTDQSYEILLSIRDIIFFDRLEDIKIALKELMKETR